MQAMRYKLSSGLAGRVFAALALVMMLAPKTLAQTLDNPQRVAFQISTGSTTGTYFPVGAMLAQLLSHPPGVERCEAANICGPSGLIVSTRASQGSVANLLGVNSGMVTSGIAQADVVAAAVPAQGPFRKNEAIKQLRGVPHLYGEDLHLRPAKKSKIKSNGDRRR